MEAMEDFFDSHLVEKYVCFSQPSSNMGARWLSGRVEEPRVQASLASMRCVLEQDTLILD